MPKKDKPDNARKGKYEEKLIVNGTFMDLIKAVVKNADDKKPEK